MDITLLNDILFKIVFGTQAQSEALRGLLNAILGLKGNQRIQQLTILSPLREKEHLDDKGSILDIKATDGDGIVYNIEVQVQPQKAYPQRSLYYAATMISQQVQSGLNYWQLKKTIHISLTDFQLFPNQADLHSVYVLYDLKNQRTLCDLLELHYVEIAKFKKEGVDDLQDPLERWLYFLRNAAKVSDLPETLKREEGMEIAMEATRTALSDEEVRHAILARKMWEMDRQHEMESAVEEGEARGRAQGEAQGEARGRAQGIREVARTMQANGLSEDIIFRATGLKLADLQG